MSPWDILHHPTSRVFLALDGWGWPQTQTPQPSAAGCEKLNSLFLNIEDASQMLKRIQASWIDIDLFKLSNNHFLIENRLIHSFFPEIFVLLYPRELNQSTHYICLVWQRRLSFLCCEIALFSRRRWWSRRSNWSGEERELREETNSENMVTVDSPLNCTK